ncbi:MAG: DNA polymerase III subunit chi [Gammaproteobacteria bacterium]
MPKIDFYILSEGNAKTRFLLTCRLIEKAYKNRHRVYIHTQTEADAHLLDEMLWTYRDESFLPHNLYGEGPDPAPPIQIGFNTTPDKHRDILINLSFQVPAFFEQFNRILEIVANDPEAQAISRENYRAYRTQGYDITTHKLQTVEL